MKIFLLISLLGSVSAFSVNQKSLSSKSIVADATRRTAIFLPILTTIATASSKVNALDMDAFANSQIEADKKNCDPKKDPKCVPTLTSDEALCKYGSSGKARGEACTRLKNAKPGQAIDTGSKGGKSLGGAYAM
jgi:hypothetical protein